MVTKVPFPCLFPDLNSPCVQLKQKKLGSIRLDKKIKNDRFSNFISRLVTQIDSFSMKQIIFPFPIVCSSRCKIIDSFSIRFSILHLSNIPVSIFQSISSSSFFFVIHKVPFIRISFAIQQTSNSMSFPFFKHSFINISILF